MGPWTLRVKNGRGGVLPENYGATCSAIERVRALWGMSAGEEDLEPGTVQGVSDFSAKAQQLEKEAAWLEQSRFAQRSSGIIFCSHKKNCILAGEITKNLLH